MYRHKFGAFKTIETDSVSVLEARSLSAGVSWAAVPSEAQGEPFLPFARLAAPGVSWLAAAPASISTWPSFPSLCPWPSLFSFIRTPVIGFRMISSKDP